jgi:hypothetical protein
MGEPEDETGEPEDEMGEPEGRTVADHERDEAVLNLSNWANFGATDDGALDQHSASSWNTDRRTEVSAEREGGDTGGASTGSEGGASSGVGGVAGAGGGAGMATAEPILSLASGSLALSAASVLDFGGVGAGMVRSLPVRILNRSRHAVEVGADVSPPPLPTPTSLAELCCRPLFPLDFPLARSPSSVLAASRGPSACAHVLALCCALRVPMRWLCALLCVCPCAGSVLCSSKPQWAPCS